jgi:hypothetical protein
MTDHTPISKISRLEVVSTGARRRWTLEEKRRIVAESYDGPRLVSVTARRNGLSASQLFTWPSGARRPAERGCRAGACSCRDYVYAGFGIVRAAIAVFASAAHQGWNHRDRTWWLLCAR